MPLTEADTKERLEELPVKKYERQTVHITLLVQDAEFDPVAFFESLGGLFESVQSEKDTVAYGDYIFRVTGNKELEEEE